MWAAAAEAKPEPPTDFVWEEQNRFRSSPDCTTILCKPNGEVSVGVKGCYRAASPRVPLLLCCSHFLQSITRVPSNATAVPPLCAHSWPAGAVVSCVMKAATDSESGVGFVFDAIWKCGIRKKMDTAFSGQFMQIISCDSRLFSRLNSHKNCNTKS